MGVDVFEWLFMTALLLLFNFSTSQNQYTTTIWWKLHFIHHLSVHSLWMSEGR